MSGSLAIGYQFPLEGRVACASRRSTVLSIHLQVCGASVRLIAVPERCLPGVKPPQFLEYMEDFDVVDLVCLGS